MLKIPLGRNAPRGSKTRLTTYSTMHATVTRSTKLRCLNSARSGPAKPHMPGLRRPHTRHVGASALVSRPHDGHKMAPVVLRNIVFLRAWRNAVALVEPLAEVDQPARERAERTLRIAEPVGLVPARRAGDLARRRPTAGGMQRDHSLIWHRDGSYRGPTNPVNSRTLLQVKVDHRRGIA